VNTKTTGAAALLGFAAATAVFAPSSSLLKTETPLTVHAEVAPKPSNGRELDVDCIMNAGLPHVGVDGGCEK
jgi:hypothetical protein